MKNWKVWILTDKDGKILAEGRKRDVIRVWYPRWCYCGIHTDTLIQTDRPLKED